MYIDSHAHLFDEEYRHDFDAVLHRAYDAGVEAIIVPGTTLETSRESVNLTQRYPTLFACVGFHPHEASKASDEAMEELEQLSAQPGVVAIGEIGLDFHYDLSPRETQRRLFRQQIDTAIRRNLPIVVHTRNSMKEAIDIVREAVLQHPTWRQGAGNGGTASLRGVFHCFTGTAEEAEQLFALGFVVSYPGIVTFKNSPVLETLSTIGFQRILLETDSPYLAPVPFRGKRNEPAHVVYVANTIASLFHVPPSEVATVTAHNTRTLFGLHTRH